MSTADHPPLVRLLAEIAARVSREASREPPPRATNDEDEAPCEQ